MVQNLVDFWELTEVNSSQVLLSVYSKGFTTPPKISKTISTIDLKLGTIPPPPKKKSLRSSSYLCKYRGKLGHNMLVFQLHLPISKF